MPGSRIVKHRCDEEEEFGAWSHGLLEVFLSVENPYGLVGEFESGAMYGALSHN